MKSINEINETNNLDQVDINDDDNNNPIIKCDYIDIESFKYKESKNNLSFFHLNIASLSKNKDELEAILSSLNFKFDCIALSETKVKRGINPIFDINLKGYNCFSTPTEANKGGTLLYISNTLKCKPRKDLENMMYKSHHLESTFIEIVNPGKKNIVTSCVYRHPSMNINEFNDNFLDPLMQKLIKETKKMFFVGDFNVDLLTINTDNSVAHFLDIFSSLLFVTHIALPTRISKNNRNQVISQTLIDNIYSNSLNFSDGISGTLTFAISDHLAQFLIMPIEVSKQSEILDCFKRDTKNFDKENFILDMLDVNWIELIQADKNKPNLSFNCFEDKLMKIIDSYIPRQN